MKPTIMHYGDKGLCAYVGDERVFQTRDKRDAQRIFLAIGLFGEVTLGTARFIGDDQLKAVAYETAKFWREAI